MSQETQGARDFELTLPHLVLSWLRIFILALVVPPYLPKDIKRNYSRSRFSE